MKRMERKATGLTGALAIAMPLLGCGSGDMVGMMNDPGTLPDPMRACMQTLPRLTVAGNQLMVQCGSDILPTRLKGINRSGLQHKNGLQMAGFGADPTPELQGYRDSWKTVAVRVGV